MTNSHRTRPARAVATLAVGLAAIPAVLGASHPASATVTRAPREPGLAVTVNDGHVSARVGDVLTYTVTVSDTGAVSAPRLEVTQTLSPGLKLVSASDHGTATSERVSWPASLKAGGSRTFRVVTRVTKTPATLLRLAAVACVALPGSSRPVICAAHLDRLPAAAAKPVSRPGFPALRTAACAAAGLAVLALAVLAAIAVRRRTRRRLA